MDALWSWLVAQDAAVPQWLTLQPDAARALQDELSARWNTVLPDVESVESMLVAGTPRVSCQLITPHGAEAGCILFLHGGGWAFGNLTTHQRFMRLLAIATGRRVLAPDYRLAPEHPFPAPFEDCRAAWRWLAADSAFQGPLAIAGDSAGANLAMAVMLDAIKAGARTPDLALLFYGVFSNDLDSPSYRRFADGFGLTQAGMTRFWDYYVPNPAARADPLVAAVHASDDLLNRLPPVYLNAAGLDPLLCDTLDFAKRLNEAGVTHELVVHEGVHHGFMQMSLRLTEAQRAIDLAAAFLINRTASDKPEPEHPAISSLPGPNVSFSELP